MLALHFASPRFWRKLSGNLMELFRLRWSMGELLCVCSPTDQKARNRYLPEGSAWARLAADCQSLWRWARFDVFAHLHSPIGPGKYIGPVTVRNSVDCAVTAAAALQEND
jgi:hypothetical protein